MTNGVIQIGLAGLGTVGTGVYETLLKNKNLLTARTQLSWEIAQIAVRHVSKTRAIDVPESLLTEHWRDLVKNPDLDVLVELMGGTTVAREFVIAALKAKKPVVTGNKALIAEFGEEIFNLSRQMNTPVYFEAAVAGGIPVIDSMRESLVCNKFQYIAGIINGTSNYILERMSSAGLDYKVALKEAQDLGYAEADPTLDVNGWDAAHKALLLALLAYGKPVDPAAIYVSGIQDVRATDIKFADQLGYAVKLLAVIRQHEDENRQIELRVQPSFVPKSHILSSVNGVFNAIAIRGDIVGETLFYGRGAGKLPTASAVISDVVVAGKDVVNGGTHNGFVPYNEKGSLMSVEETVTPYYVRFKVSNTETGIIAGISGVLARFNISISQINSRHRAGQEFNDLAFVLHECPFGLLEKALEEIRHSSWGIERPVVFRIEEFKM